ncbi:MAG: type II toxin-antitoxin system RelE/ParE family toxin [Candidatus Latescibacterota bacterium]
MIFWLNSDQSGARKVQRDSVSLPLMSPSFSIPTSSRFRRDAQKLIRQHPELEAVLGTVHEILRADPYNRTKQHDIAKLTGVKPGLGQWRIRQGDYRLRYDIFGQDVVLYSFRHRREVY